MITIWNRLELISTFDMQKQAEVTQILSHHKIDYRLKVMNRRSSSPFASGSRSRTGTLGENLNLEYEYTIFVRKEDKDKASYLINHK